MLYPVYHYMRSEYPLADRKPWLQCVIWKNVSNYGWSKICVIEALKTHAMSFTSRKARRAAYLRLLSPRPDTSLHCKTTASRSVPVYGPAFASNSMRASTRRGEGMARLSSHPNGWLRTGNPIWFTRFPKVTHPSTNRARRRLTSLIGHNGHP